MKPEITLVYDADCPNLPAARGALRKALEHEGLEPQWVEYDRAAPGTLALLLRFGSPTILVEGVDVGGEAGHAAAAASCRAYRGERGLSGVPSAESIAVAIADIKVASLWRARVGRNGESHDREPFGALLQTTAAKSF